MTYDYSDNEKLNSFFKLIDLTPGDGAINIADYEKLKKDLGKNINVNSGRVLTASEVTNLNKYEEAKEMLKSWGNSTSPEPEEYEAFTELKNGAYESGYSKSDD
jgi:hypothetical protein